MLPLPLKVENPKRRFPAWTLLLIAANLLTFYLVYSRGTQAANESLQRYALYPDLMLSSLTAGGQEALSSLERLMTHMFLHGSIAHLGGNMLFLWVFGNNVEEAFGPLLFVTFYFFCGLAAVVAHILTGQDISTPMIGASGAVAGILGAYTWLYPRARVLTLLIIPFPLFFFWGLFRVIRLPAFLFLGLWFVWQALMGMAGLAESGVLVARVAYFAHVGGYAAGLLLTPVLSAAGCARPGRR